MSTRESGIDFVNTIHEDSERYNLVDYYYVYNGAGVALGDVNNDGWTDIYLTGNLVSSRLYVNRGGLSFEDVTEKAGVGTAGWSTGAAFADVDADGYLDLYVSRAGPVPPEERTNLFFRNNGDLTFTETGDDLGIADTSFSTQSAFFDYDKDGDLDLFLLNHSNEDRPNLVRQMMTDGTGVANDRLYRQEPSGRFTDVTIDAGILKAGLSLGVGITDLDGDGWEDIYVSNDFMVHDHLYMNDGDGTFTERGSELLKHHSFASMGHDFADMNNDGLTDLMVLDMRPPDNEQQKRQAFPMTETYFRMSLDAGYHPQYWRNVLQLNEGKLPDGDPVFADIGQYAGVDATGWSWGPLFADFDNDGLKDLLITNGYLRAVVDWDFINKYVAYQLEVGVDSAKERVKALAENVYDIARVDYLYRNTGDLRFQDVSREWGFKRKSFSNGAAYGDLDNDGDLDLVVSEINAPSAVFENRSMDPNYLEVKLAGAGKNLRGIGSDVHVYCGGEHQFRHQALSRGYQSAVDETIHFGLGACVSIDSLRIVWSDGASQKLEDVSTRQVLTLRRSDAVRYTVPSEPLPDPLLRERAAERNVEYRHVEEPFNDFERQRLLPHKHSRQGPGLAVGDVNGDGLDDFFVGGAYRHAGRLFVQQTDGTFRGAAIDLQPRKFEEDLGALFFDADGDGDVDLYVASGSSEFMNGTAYLQDRLYRNDGAGSFSFNPDALPDVSTSSSCVTAADFDADGDLDLFVCGRVQPLRYPLSGRSYLLRNDGGTFSDATADAGADLREIGMVSAALWSDFDSDGRLDLIVAGEFMPVRFYRNTVDGFLDVTDQSGLSGTSGWWNSIAGADFDGDGDTDYVLGNLGLNSKLHASPAEPVRVYGGDFDFNGHIDPILTLYIRGEEYPMASFEDFTAQLPEEKLYFDSVEQYGKTPFKRLFNEQQLGTAVILEASRFTNSYLENLGGGRFEMGDLPGRAQLGPLYGLVADDLDEDGRPDLMAVGNSYSPDVVTGRYDALNGIWLRGDGAGGFDAVPFQKSGLYVPGDGKALARLVGADGSRLYLATENDGPLRVFETGAGSSVVVQLEPLDAVADIEQADGSHVRRELYYGSGYLSQSSRKLFVPEGATSVRVRRFDGTERTVPISTAN